MGINKEKLLKKLPCLRTNTCIKCDNYDDESSGYECIGNVIKNISEEPEQPIDFDALYEAFKDLCEGNNYQTCGLKVKIGCDEIQCFCSFLKSKNLTQPQIDIDQLRHDVYSEIVKPKFEIPVRKTWTLKKEYVEFCKHFELYVSDISVTLNNVDPFEHLKQYYDPKEEPDYSKITKGSIVELNNKMSKQKFTAYLISSDNYFVNTTKGSYKIDNYDIRVVELAKE